MAIGSGWVGSQAVAETGQRWMSAAGSAVKVSTPFWMSALVCKSVVGVASYVTRSGEGYDTANWVFYNSSYIEITLTAPFSGTIATDSSSLEVSTSDAIFNDNTTAGVTHGTSISVANVQKFYVGIRFDMSGNDTERRPVIAWKLLLNGSAVATYATIFWAARAYDTTTPDSW